jgi:hypothetical protein
MDMAAEQGVKMIVLLQLQQSRSLLQAASPGKRSSGGIESREMFEQQPKWGALWRMQQFFESFPAVVRESASRAVNRAGPCSVAEDQLGWADDLSQGQIMQLEGFSIQAIESVFECFAAVLVLDVGIMVAGNVDKASVGQFQKRFEKTFAQGKFLEVPDAGQIPGANKEISLQRGKNFGGLENPFCAEGMTSAQQKIQTPKKTLVEKTSMPERAQSGMQIGKMNDAILRHEFFLTTKRHEIFWELLLCRMGGLGVDGVDSVDVVDSVDRVDGVDGVDGVDIVDVVDRPNLPPAPCPLHPAPLYPVFVEFSVQGTSADSE